MQTTKKSLLYGSRLIDRQRGVNLVELMVVVTIVAILGAIAYPSYQNQMVRSHRTEAKAALLQVQVAQEKYFLQNNKYGALADLGPTSLGLQASGLTSHGYYLITLAKTDTTFTGTAAPQGGQTSDTCGTYSIDQANNKTPTTSGCW